MQGASRHESAQPNDNGCPGDKCSDDRKSFGTGQHKGQNIREERVCLGGANDYVKKMAQ